MNNTNPQTPKLDEAGISLLAYQKWQEAGCPEGQDMKFWFEAESQLRAATKVAMGASPSVAPAAPAPKHSSAPQPQIALKVPNPPKSPLQTSTPRQEQKVHRL